MTISAGDIYGLMSRQDVVIVLIRRGIIHMSVKSRGSRREKIHRII